MKLIICFYLSIALGFPDSSVGKESVCNIGGPSLIPGSGRSPGEGKGYPLQYSWTSLVAQLVKNLPAVRETWVRSLCWEDPLKKGKTTHSSILPWRTPWTTQTMGLQRVRHDWETFTFTFRVPQVVLLVKNPSANAEDLRCGFDPLVGKIPGGGHGNPLQYSYLE